MDGRPERRHGLSRLPEGSGREKIAATPMEEAAAIQSAKQLHVHQPGIVFVPGAKLQVLETIDNKWYESKVVEVDWGELDILVHYQKWNDRFDEWLKMDSKRIKPSASNKSAEACLFRVGDAVMALWAPDQRRYPAKIIRIINSSHCEVLFQDNIVKTLRCSMMTKLHGRGPVETLPVASPPAESIPRSAPPAPPTTPATDGSKKSIFDVELCEEKRKPKRKAEFVELFDSMKRKKLVQSPAVASRCSRLQSQPSTASPSSSFPLRPSRLSLSHPSPSTHELTRQRTKSENLKSKTQPEAEEQQSSSVSTIDIISPEKRSSPHKTRSKSDASFESSTPPTTRDNSVENVKETPPSDTSSSKQTPPSDTSSSKQTPPSDTSSSKQTHHESDALIIDTNTDSTVKSSDGATPVRILGPFARFSTLKPKEQQTGHMMIEAASPLSTTKRAPVAGDCVPAWEKHGCEMVMCDTFPGWQKQYRRCVPDECPATWEVTYFAPDGSTIRNKRHLSSYAENNTLPCLVVQFDFSAHNIKEVMIAHMSSCRETAATSRTAEQKQQTTDGEEQQHNEAQQQDTQHLQLQLETHPQNTTKKQQPTLQQRQTHEQQFEKQPQQQLMIEKQGGEEPQEQDPSAACRPDDAGETADVVQQKCVTGEEDGMPAAQKLLPVAKETAPDNSHQMCTVADQRLTAEEELASEKVQQPEQNTPGAGATLHNEDDDDEEAGVCSSSDEEDVSAVVSPNLKIKKMQPITLHRQQLDYDAGEASAAHNCHDNNNKTNSSGSVLNSDKERTRDSIKSGTAACSHPTRVKIEIPINPDMSKAAVLLLENFAAKLEKTVAANVATANNLGSRTPARQKNAPPKDMLSPLEDLEEHVCTVKDCAKTFRKLSLLQMHVKHYHPWMRKGRGVAAPNVADLAYARTIASPLYSPISQHSAQERRQKRQAAAELSDSKRRRTDKDVTRKVSAAPMAVKEEASTATLVIDSSSSCGAVQHSGATVDCSTAAGSDVAQELLVVESSSRSNICSANGKPLLMPRPLLLDSASDEEEFMGFPSPAKKEQRRTAISKLLPAQSPHKPDKPSSPLKSSGKLLPSPLKSEKDTSAELDESGTSAAGEAAGGGCGATGEETDATVEAADEEDEEDDSFSDDIINCCCLIMEEDGLMLQCDVCMCWQHASCYAIQNTAVPEKYVCSMCTDPKLVRSNHRFYHVISDWLKEGLLPRFSFARDDKSEQQQQYMQRSQQLTAQLLQQEQLLHAIKLALTIAKKADHPKLVMWHKQWPHPRATHLGPNATNNNSASNASSLQLNNNNSPQMNLTNLPCIGSLQLNNPQPNLNAMHPSAVLLPTDINFNNNNNNVLSSAMYTGGQQQQACQSVLNATLNQEDDALLRDLLSIEPLLQDKPSGNIIFSSQSTVSNNYPEPSTHVQLNEIIPVQLQHSSTIIKDSSSSIHLVETRSAQSVTSCVNSDIAAAGSLLNNNDNTSQSFENNLDIGDLARKHSVSDNKEITSGLKTSSAAQEGPFESDPNNKTNINMHPRLLPDTADDNKDEQCDVPTSGVTIPKELTEELSNECKTDQSSEKLSNEYIDDASEVAIHSDSKKASGMETEDCATLTASKENILNEIKSPGKSVFTNLSENVTNMILAYSPGKRDDLYMKSELGNTEAPVLMSSVENAPEKSEASFNLHLSLSEDSDKETAADNKPVQGTCDQRSHSLTHEEILKENKTDRPPKALKSLTEEKPQLASLSETASKDLTESKKKLASKDDASFSGTDVSSDSDTGSINNTVVAIPITDATSKAASLTNSSENSSDFSTGSGGNNNLMNPFTSRTNPSLAEANANLSEANSNLSAANANTTDIAQDSIIGGGNSQSLEVTENLDLGDSGELDTSDLGLDLQDLLSSTPSLEQLVLPAINAVATPHQTIITAAAVAVAGGAGVSFPEAERIEPIKCKLNLLSHVQAVQDTLEQTYDGIEQQIRKLEEELGLPDIDEEEEEESSSGGGGAAAADVSCRQLVQMLLADMNTVQRLAHYTGL
uniref:Mucin-5AC-like n=1 Tax=Hirondellea gigas TaxID=1518452 RepID=A0A6A7FVI3_9CRUS